jgi:hypothetical protein
MLTVIGETTNSYTLCLDFKRLCFHQYDSFHYNFFTLSFEEASRHRPHDERVVPSAGKKGKFRSEQR